jgi:serine/threonine-protein kinase
MEIQAGRTTTVNVPVPNGSLSINALPWAEILIDGKPVGTTPLGNLSVPIGTHEIVWRHPQLGERTRTVTVPARTPVRLGMDLSR